MPWSFTAQQLQRAFCFYLFSLGVSIPVIFPHLNWKKPQYVLFVLVLWSCFSSWQWNSAQKVSVWFNTIQSGCEWQNSAKICSLWNCSVLTHEQSCCFTKTSHIILKTLSPWSLFQWGGSPLWGHERVFQINFSYHTGMDENLVTLFALHQIFVTSHPGTHLKELVFLKVLLFPLLWAWHRTGIGLLLHCQVYRQLLQYCTDQCIKHLYCKITLFSLK